MHNTILINTLKSLSKRELTKFQEYVHSPFFNKHEKQVLLVDYVAKYYPDFSSSKLDKKTVFKYLFPKLSYRESKMNNCISDLLKLLESYLAYTEWQKNELIVQRNLMVHLFEKRLDKHFQRILKSIRRSIKQQNLFDTDHYLLLYNIEKDEDLYNIFNNEYQKEIHLQRSVDNLDRYYFVNKLKMACEMVNRQNIVKIQFDLHFLEELLTYIENQFERFQKTPEVLIYYAILQTLTQSKEESHYPKLIALLDEHAEKFYPQDAIEMYAYAQNYCIKKINNGQDDYLSELFKLYKQLLEKQLLIKNDTLEERHYKNIVTVSLRLNEFDWTKHFIYQYKEYLLESIRENAFQYNLASMYYEQKNYDDALQLLNTVEFTNVMYYLDSKSMLLKIYYDLDESGPLFSLIDAVNIYLKRSKTVAKYQNTIYHNLFRFTKRAYKIKEQMPYSAKEKNQKDFKKLQELIHKNPEIANKKWLFDKVNELEKSI